ncbi:Adenylosuccinate synthetase [Pelomyxa schiedti]|nr:Adenylosuccinate synthetase [Pelomyxa schiedti]
MKKKGAVPKGGAGKGGAKRGGLAKKKNSTSTSAVAASSQHAKDAATSAPSCTATSPCCSLATPASTTPSSAAAEGSATSANTSDAATSAVVCADAAKGTDDAPSPSPSQSASASASARDQAAAAAAAMGTPAAAATATPTTTTTGSRQPRALIVGGLGFGDEGKGSIVDFLCRAEGATLVVRHTGGPQAAHHIVLPDGKWHCFSQFGSGMLVPGVSTLLSKYMHVSPITLEPELDRLVSEMKVFNAKQRLWIDFGCPLVLPAHKLLGRLRELCRGKNRYGSTGAGVGIAALDTEAERRGDPNAPTVIRIKDLCDPAVLKDKLTRHYTEKLTLANAVISEYMSLAPPPEGVCCSCGKKGSTSRCTRCLNAYYCGTACQRGHWPTHKLSCKSFSARVAQLKHLDHNVTSYEPSALNEMLKLVKQMSQQYSLVALMELLTKFFNSYSSQFVNGTDFLRTTFGRGEAVVFEGAQAALIDKDHGFHPYITKTSCTSENALSLIAETGVPCTVSRIGVMRSYGVRHGAGPFVTESTDPSFAALVPEIHNTAETWQGKYRSGALDLLVLKYGVDIFGGVDYIALTHTDCMRKLGDKFSYCDEYEYTGAWEDCIPDFFDVVGTPQSQLQPQPQAQPGGAVVLRALRNPRSRTPAVSELSRSGKLAALMGSCRPRALQYLPVKPNPSTDDLGDLRSIVQTRAHGTNGFAHVDRGAVPADVMSLITAIEGHLCAPVGIVSFGAPATHKFFLNP